jgi:nucleoside-diphosphate-sugar epimerase
MRIAVLGASGVAGSAFVKLASEAGHELRTERTDLFNAWALGQLVSSCDAVVNLASSVPKPGGRGSWPINDRLRREGFRTLLRACGASTVKVIVQQSLAMLHCASDSRAQDEDDPLYGGSLFLSAAEMEAAARVSQQDIRMVRGGLFYGANTGFEARLLAQLQTDGFQVPGEGLGWISPVHAEDYASAVLRVLEAGAPRQAYIACDDRPLQLGELYRVLAEQHRLQVPRAGGPLTMPSFRVSNAKLRGLGWSPRNALLDAA